MLSFHIYILIRTKSYCHHSFLKGPVGRIHNPRVFTSSKCQQRLGRSKSALGFFSIWGTKLVECFIYLVKWCTRIFLWLSFFLCKITTFSKEVQVRMALGKVTKNSWAALYNITAQNPITKSRWKMISAKETEAICEHFVVSSLSPSLPTLFNKTASPNVALSTY